jgi:uncharacterized membrane protein
MAETIVDDPIFHARLTPYRSLGRRGFHILMAVLIFCWMMTGLVFLSMGAWPIFGFFGLDVLLIYLAFQWNYHSAQAHEEVKLSPHSLAIRKVAASGRTSEHGFNPLWTKFNVKRHDFIGVTAMSVEGHGKYVTLGSFLNPDDRESFAKAFASALSQAKRA